jgi:hypothetical protein
VKHVILPIERAFSQMHGQVIFARRRLRIFRFLSPRRGARYRTRCSDFTTKLTLMANRSATSAATRHFDEAWMDVA